jgi:hypothetical protein
VDADQATFFGRVDDRIHIAASSRSQAGMNPDIRYAAMIYATGSPESFETWVS